MSEERSTWCRISECAAGLRATVDGDLVRTIEVDPEHALGGHDSCGLCTSSTGARNDARRLLRPKKRTPSGWQEVSWDEAIKEIGAQLKALRAKGGPGAIGTWAGAPVALNAAGTARTLAWSLGLGSPHLFSPLATRGGPWIRAGELVTGHPVALQGDVGRAHYVVLLGANQAAQGWGPMQLGRSHGPDLAFSRKTKGTKVVAVDPRKTPMAAAADIHHAIRPGTELFYVLGMIDQITKNEWHEAQYVADYTEGYDAMRAALSEWPIERCAAICGIAAEDIGGVALKFSRAAMAVVHRSAQALDSERGTLTAWAMLALHGITANLLRPGGLFDAKGVPDIHPVATQLGTDKAPRVDGRPLHLLQAPAAAFAPAVDQGGLAALVCVHGDPARELDAAARAALAKLDLIVAIDVCETETTKLAHWVLPATHAWERADVHLHDADALPVRHNQWTEALVSPPGEARNEAEILRDLFGAVGPTMRKGAYGVHLQALGTMLARADLDGWMERALSLSAQLDRKALGGRGWNGGDLNRAEWRPTKEKLDLLPPEVAEALRHLRPPEEAPLRLLTSAARDMAVRAFDRPAGADPGVTLHPSLGHAAGSRVRIRTQAGAVEAVVSLDEGLRPDVVDLPAGYATDVYALLPSAPVDPFTGTPALNGLACTVEAV